MVYDQNLVFTLIHHLPGQEDGCTGVFLDLRDGNERCRVQKGALRGIVLQGTSLLEEN